MARRGVAWPGVALHGIAWHGMAWHGIAWHGMAWHGMTSHYIHNKQTYTLRPAIADKSEGAWGVGTGGGGVWLFFLFYIVF